MLVLLTVGATSRKFIAEHKNTREHFEDYDFDLLGLIIAEFSEIILVPHVVAEASNLVGQIGNPKRAQIRNVLAEIVSTSLELPILSMHRCRREDYPAIGVTDAVLMHTLSLMMSGFNPTLLTIDGPLADRAASLGYSVIDYKREFG